MLCSGVNARSIRIFVVREIRRPKPKKKDTTYVVSFFLVRPKGLEFGDRHFNGYYPCQNRLSLFETENFFVVSCLIALYVFFLLRETKRENLLPVILIKI